MDDDKIIEMIQVSLYGYEYILNRDSTTGRSTYIKTIMEDIKYKLRHDKDRN